MCYVLVAFLILQEIWHRIERRDLYNRIMSRDLGEYKGDVPRSYRSAHRKVLDKWRGKDGEEE